MIEGGQLFYAQNTGLQRQSPVFVRASLDAPPALVIDPNVISEDGSLSLAQWTPSPDAKLLAYGLAEGGADWRDDPRARHRYRQGSVRRSAVDALLDISWTKDARASSTRAIPSRRRTRCSRPRCPGRRSTTTASARRSRRTR